MNFRGRLAVVVLIVGGVGISFAQAGEPFVWRQLPGLEVGQASTRWLAPYVLATTYAVDKKPQATVRWFDHAGAVLKELAGPGLNPRPDYISERRNNRNIIHDVMGEWQLGLPEKPGPSGLIAGVGDTFVQEFHPVEGQVAVDVYSKGSLVGTAGPFVQYKANGVELANDGNMALVTWTTAKKQAVQVLVIGPDGKIRFQSDCEREGLSGAPTCRPVAGGHGILMRLEGHPEPPVWFAFKVTGGSWMNRAIGTNAWPMECALPGNLVLFDLSVGEEERFQLFDCGTGKPVWEIASPVQHWTGTIAGVVGLEDMLLFVSRDFAAVNLNTGNVIARWEPNVPRRDRGWFAKRGGKLFFVTEDTFAQIDLTDIRAKRNQWH
jgi:hypothetical protein